MAPGVTKWVMIPMARGATRGLRQGEVIKAVSDKVIWLHVVFVRDAG